MPILPLFHSGLPLTHDGPDHIARIANFYASLTEGNPVPRWAGNLNWGYGHPILMFLYPLPSYLGSLFKAIGFPFVDAVKLVFGVSFIASILSMYLWVSAVWGKRAGAVAAILYGFAPYRFVDMTIRGAIGEHVAFVFPPLICYFLYMLAKRSDTFRTRSAGVVAAGVGLTLSAAGLILSHNAVALMFVPVVGLYWLYLLRYGTEKPVAFAMGTGMAVALAAGVSAFFWAPAFFEGKYTLRDIVTRGETVTRFVPWTWFFWSPWKFGQGNEFTKEIGLPQLLGVVALFGTGMRSRNRRFRVVAIGFLSILIVSLVLMTAVSRPVWDAVSVMQKFQFPWRFLSVSVFAAAVAGGLAFRELTSRLDSGKRLLATGAACVIAVAVTVRMWQPLGYTTRLETYYSGIYDSTTDTGESSPVWSVRFMEHRAKAPLEAIDGDARITQGKRTTTLHAYTVETAIPVRLLENTLYFPGWGITVDGTPVGIQYQDPAYRGLMTFTVPVGKHDIEVAFGETKLRRLADMVSVAAGVVLAFAGIGTLVLRRHTAYALR